MIWTGAHEFSADQHLVTTACLLSWPRCELALHELTMDWLVLFVSCLAITLNCFEVVWRCLLLLFTVGVLLLSVLVCLFCPS